MKKEDKSAIIVELQKYLDEYQHFYITNIEGLNAEKTSALRRLCFNSDVKKLWKLKELMSKFLQRSKEILH